MKNVYLDVTRLLAVLIFCIAFQPVFAQNGVAIAAGTSATADNSAMLDIQSTSKGVLIPRMSSTNRLAITNPANGLLVYDNNLNYFMYYTGGPTGNISTDWIILNTGGVGTTGGTQYYLPVWNSSNGLTNSRFYDNGTATGIGIGTASPAALIDINGNGGLITAASAAGGNVKITGQNAAGTNQNGGSIVLTPGTSTGTGTSGVGIGTASVPVGGIGAAILAITGTKSSNYGPHIQYTTTADNYPLFQQLNWNHGNVALIFDASYNSSAGYVASSNLSGTASTTNTPYEIIEGSGVLNFNYDATPPTQGTSFSWTTGMSLNGSGVVQIPNLAGTGNRPVSADATGNLHVGSSLGYSSSNKATFTYSASSGTGASGNPSTGATWTIPTGVTQAFVKLWGAGGGGNTSGGSVGGGGGFISGWLTWPSGTTSLTIIVGGGGGLGNPNGTAGTNGGGSSNYQGGGGGGRSCIQISATDYVAAGGGGGSIDGNFGRGGGGGGGGQGLTGFYGTTNGQATGGTQTAVGSSGAGATAASGHVGGSHPGGSGDSYGGGGGGGWFGGGAGGSSSANGNDGAGAGGSSGGNSTYFTFVEGQAGQMYMTTSQPLGPTLSGGAGDPDYVYGIGEGGNPNTGNNNVANTAGNGYVVIYW